MSAEIGRDDCVALLREQLVAAEKQIRFREDSARHWRTVTAAEWKAAMKLHPSTRGARMPSEAERERSAAIDDRIAAKARRERDVCRYLLVLFGEPDA